MRPSNTIPVSRVPPAALLDTCEASQILGADAGIDWPNGAEPRDVHVERAWPARTGGFVVEWSFRLGNGSRYVLFATSCDDAGRVDGADSNVPVVTAQGIRGLHVRVPGRCVLIHSPDRDPAMPHLVRCLDEREMAERLGPLWKGRGGFDGDPTSHVECRSLSYRAGRRAAIGYRLPASDDPSARLMGKTYCDGRGEHLPRRHEELDSRLASSTDGRVRVPTAVGYLSDVRMAVFAWIRGEESSPGTPKPGDLRHQAGLAADALAALHLETVEDLPEFTVADECAVVNRWYAALHSVDVRFSEATRLLLDALHSRAESADLDRLCTLHRDFYEGQFFSDGRTITILDLDTLALGDPCLDVGNVLAHMFLQNLRASVPVHQFTSAGKVMLRRYADRMTNHRGTSGSGPEKRALLNPQRLTFYWASALFRVGAIHALRTSTGHYAAPLWLLAEELLTGRRAGQRASGSATGDRDIIPDPQCIIGELSS